MPCSQPTKDPEIKQKTGVSQCVEKKNSEQADAASSTRQSSWLTKATPASANATGRPMEFMISFGRPEKRVKKNTSSRSCFKTSSSAALNLLISLLHAK